MYSGGASANGGKLAMKEWILTNIGEGSKILDLGAGQGNWAHLLEDGEYIIHAVEIYEGVTPQIINDYHTVYCMNLLDFDFRYNYDLVIMGDVLEHLSVADAQYAIQKALRHTKWLLVAVPFEYEQGMIADNPAEEHLQPDLTFDVIEQRYPRLQLKYYIEEDGGKFNPDGSQGLLKYAYYIAKGDI